MKYVLVAMVVGVLGTLVMACMQTDHREHPVQAERLSLTVEGYFPALAGASGWLNSPPLTSAGLRGNVVLIDFWTYTCINWRRSLPYVRAWSQKYRGQGLVVIGVHTPEFDFEKNEDNVRSALTAMRIDYPIAVDSRQTIWNAFRNSYWPAIYIVDAEGRVRYHQFGEGEYDKVERVIQQLLVEKGASDFDHELVEVQSDGTEAAADWADLESPENYVGYERTANFASSGGATWNRSRVYALPASMTQNHWALSGPWTFERQSIALNAPNGRIAYQFHARDMHLVMGPATRGTAVRFRVLLDGHSPGDAHGEDIDAQGYGTVTEQRMYQLLRQTGPIKDRRVEIEFLDSGVQAFSFTFG